MIFVSVVRDFDMYHRCVDGNKFNQNAKFVFFDNLKENKTISQRYNTFLENYDYSKPDWFVFCHEDWMLLEDLERRLKNLNKDGLYGPIGMPILDGSQFKTFPLKTFPHGQIDQSDKNGANKQKVGMRQRGEVEIGTFDCQCLIVHSSLIKKYNLRFDENLTFDLYVEDFCIYAREKHNISSKVLQLKCHHFSFGNIQKRFFQQYSYLQRKYKKARYTYQTTCSRKIIGKCLFPYYMYKKYFKVIRFFFQKKITKNGFVIVKICKIPICRKKVQSL